MLTLNSILQPMAFIELYNITINENACKMIDT